ncbi:hypothetical protein [Wenjunlia tyrosinilytica]|uniref:Uncharacterized protein n=1 Tax=Wenjunlia tyrosinilytica TaxID=1544741 RepID=A0A917ZWQ3_9ACTN|nr:hypothetical protein [Wenjunlia tyrosinilytica]GGO96272.1 hypothetical protein GCM10012280_55390 [Wenjunlia tyrosinilytica]
MWDGIRGFLRGGARTDHEEPRQRNLFEAAADYVVASADNDEAAKDAARSHVDPDALMFGVSELARRAVVAMAAERGTSPEAMARLLLGLPAERPRSGRP